MGERHADLTHPALGEARDSGREQAEAEAGEVVERQRARVGHPVRALELDFRGNPTDAPGGGHAEYLVQHSDRLVAGQDEKRATTGARVLVPPDLAASYQGS